MRTRTTSNVRWIIVTATLASGVLAGCAREMADPEPETPRTEAPLRAVPGAYLGRVGASDVFVAVVPQRKTIRVYACDALDLTHATVDQWFEGGYDGIGPVTLTAGGLSLTLRTEAGGFVGELTLASGISLPFSAMQPGDRGSALLDAEVRDPATGATLRDGNVIVLGGEQRGTLIPTRPPRCRLVLVMSGNGRQQWVTTC